MDAVVYKKTQGRSLSKGSHLLCRWSFTKGIYIYSTVYFPKRPLTGNNFYHGGGWYKGNPEGFKRTCQYFCQQGWVGITFDYRLSDFKDITPVECIMDVKSSVRWVREHAKRLRIHPGKIVAGNPCPDIIIYC